MKEIDGISTEDLQKELDNRKEKEKLELKPKLLKEPDIKPLQEICQKYIDELAAEGHVYSDLDHYICEKALEVCFGQDVFKYINSISD